jgi:HSP20 family protein
MKPCPAGGQCRPPAFNPKKMTTTLNKPELKTSAGDGARDATFATPLANIHETADGYLLEAEMPGVSKDGLEITVENGELSIVGHRGTAAEPGRNVYRESRAWDYRRVFELDPSIDSGKITAKIDQGVLTLHLPKAEAVKPRKISVG